MFITRLTTSPIVATSLHMVCPVHDVSCSADQKISPLLSWMFAFFKIIFPWEMWQYYITVTSSWARWCLKSPAYRLLAQPFVQVQIKGNVKAPRQWPLWGESAGHVMKQIWNKQTCYLQPFGSHYIIWLRVYTQVFMWIEFIVPVDLKKIYQESNKH